MMSSRTVSGALAVAGALACSCGKTSTTGGVTCGADTVEQNGQCVAAVYANGWDNALTQELGVSLVKQFSGSDEGDAGWDPAIHPLVFITSLGPGYGGILGGTTWPGVVIIDANDYSIVAYKNYDMTSEGWTDVFEPHALAVSPDGKWIYLPTGDGRDKGRFLIINARTLKLDKMIKTRGRPHHATSFVDADGGERVVGYGWEQPPFVMDPKNNNRVIGGFSYNESGLEGYLYFVTPDGKEMWGSGRWRQSSTGNVVEGQVFYSVNTTTWKLKDYMTFPEETTPIWIDFSPDNKYAFVSGAHSGSVLRYDRTKSLAQNQDGGVKISKVGVVGPYGLRLNWDGSKIYAVGKQEGAGNRGIDLGIVETARIGDPTYDGGENVVTNCLRGDHATLHPTYSKQELWLSCNSSFDVVVFDVTSKTVKQRIPMPPVVTADGGTKGSASTHSGAFVQYDSNFNGKVLSDQNGFAGTARAEQLSRWTLP